MKNPHLIYHNGTFYIGSTSDFILACNTRPDEDLSLRKATQEEIKIYTDREKYRREVKAERAKRMKGE